MNERIEAKLKRIMAPLWSAEYVECRTCDCSGTVTYQVSRFDSDIKACDTCEGKGYVHWTFYEPDDGGEAGL